MGKLHIVAALDAKSWTSVGLKLLETLDEFELVRKRYSQPELLTEVRDKVRDQPADAEDRLIVLMSRRGAVDFKSTRSILLEEFPRLVVFGVSKARIVRYERLLDREELTPEGFVDNVAEMVRSRRRQHG